MVRNLDYKELMDRVLSVNRANPFEIDLTLFRKDLAALDLAQTSCNSFKGWMKRATANFIKLLRDEMPGYFTEDTVLLMDALGVIDETFREVHIYYAWQKHHWWKSTKSNRSDFFHYFIRNLFGRLENMKRDGRVRVLYRILKFINRFIITSAESNEQDIFKLLLINLVNYFHQDSEVVISCLRMFFNNAHLTSLLFEHMADQNNLDFVLFHARRMRCTYYTIWEGVGDGFSNWNGYIDHFYTSRMIIYFMLLDRMECIPILLKYGFRFQFVPFARTLMNKLLTRVGHDGTRIHKDTWSVFEKFQQRELMALYIYVTLVNIDICKHGRKAILCISRADPDPFITPLKMYDTLMKAMIPVNEAQVFSIKYAVLNLYDEDYLTYMPKRLSHLARCVIRKRLADNYQLPEGIEDLGLPQRIKSYLYLQE